MVKLCRISQPLISRIQRGAEEHKDLTEELLIVYQT